MAASQPGSAQATAVSAAATNPYASAYANYPTAYQQGTQPAEYQQVTQVGAYQQGTQPAAYQQGTQAGAYPYAYDAAAAYQMHAAQAGAYSGYSGYPVAGYAQSAVPNYHTAYSMPPQPVSSSAADASNMYGTVASTGYPTGQVQPSSGTANAAQAPPPPPPPPTAPTAPYPGTYDPTRGAQR